MKSKAIDRVSVSIFLLTAGCILALVGGGVVGADTNSDYEIEVEGAIEVPTETVSIPPGSGGDEYEIDAIAVLEPGEELTANAAVPDDTQVNESIVQLFNSDQRLETQSRPDANGDVQFDGSDTDISPGTYNLALADGGFQAIHPVVISGYDISVDHPAEVAENDTLTVEADVVQTEADGPPTVVKATLWNETAETRSELTLDGNGASETYTGSISLAEFDSGEYNLYITVHGDEEFQGRKEILGLENADTVSVSETTDEGGSSPGDTDQGTSGGSTDNGSDGAGDGTTNGTTDTTNGTTDATNGTTDGTSNDDEMTGSDSVPPVTSESRSIADDVPSETGLTVQFSLDTVQSVTFYEGSENGSITVEEYDGIPPNGPDIGDRPVISGMVITPSERHRDSQAAIEVTVNQDKLSRAGVSAEELTMLKATGDGYQALETAVVESNEGPSLRGETDGFSIFIVSTNVASDQRNGTETTTENGTPERVIEPSEPASSTEADEPDDQPGFVLGTTLIGLAVAVLIARFSVVLRSWP